MLRFIAIFFFFIAAKGLFSQEEMKSPWSIGFNYGRGFMITHNPTMEYVSQQHTRSFELTAEKRLIGQKAWHQRYNFPFVGIKFMRFNFEKDEFFGNAYSLAPYLSFHLIDGQRTDLRIRTTIGIGYIENTFDVYDNHKNVAIGSPINVYFSILLFANVELSDRFNLTAGLDYAHFSNTAYEKPNLGINLPQAVIGLSYIMGDRRKPEKKDGLQETDDNRYLQLRWGNGLNDLSAGDGPKYLASAFSVEYEKSIGIRSSIGFGTDLYYNPAQKEKLALDSVYISSGWENLQIGISAHHLLKLGLLEAGFKLGYYFKKEDPDLKDFYTEIYGQHRIKGDLLAFASIKTHLAKAEYLLFGVKYRFGLE